MDSPVAFACAAFVAVGCTSLLLPPFALTSVYGPLQPAWMRVMVTAQLLLLLLPLTFFVARRQPLALAELFRLRRASPATCALTVVATALLLPIVGAYQAVQSLYLVPAEWMAWYRSITDATHTAYATILGWNDAPGLVLSLGMASIAAPLAEEFFARGLIQRTLERSLAPAAAISFGAAMFSIMHVQPQNAVALFVTGLFLGYLAWRTRSILPPMLAHAALNTMQLAMLGQPDPLARRISPTAEILPTALSHAGVALVLFAVTMTAIARLNRTTETPTSS